MLGSLWGPSSNLDYWTAREAGLVAPEERRAVSLLAEICDEPRFALYCRMGSLPAMGNVTKRIYLIQRGSGVVELDDGVPVASWCIHAPNRRSLPESDHVAGMKVLLEGEERIFRATGNRSGWYQSGDGRNADNPYETPFLPDRLRRLPALKGNDDFADLDGAGLQDALRLAKFRQWFHHRAILEKARHVNDPPPPPREMNVAYGMPPQGSMMVVDTDASTIPYIHMGMAGTNCGYVQQTIPVLRHLGAGLYGPFA
jgi:hypothetical protein